MSYSKCGLYFQDIEIIKTTTAISYHEANNQIFKELDKEKNKMKMMKQNQQPDKDLQIYRTSKRIGCYQEKIFKFGEYS